MPGLEARRSNWFSGNARQERERKMLILSATTLGDSLMSTAVAQRVEKYFPQADLTVGVWNCSHHEIFNSIGFNTIQLPNITAMGLKAGLPIKKAYERFVVRKEGLFGFAWEVVEFYKMLHDYDQVISFLPLRSTPRVYRWMVRASAQISGSERGRLLVSQNKDGIGSSTKYAGFFLQDQLDELLGIEERLPYFFDPAVKLSESHSLTAQRAWDDLDACPSSALICNPRSSYESKNLTSGQITSFVESCQEQGVMPVLVNYSADQKNWLEAKFKDRVVFAPRLPILETGAFIKQARGYVGGDTGLTHLAAILGMPTAVIFGPTDNKIYVNPHHANVMVFRQEMACSSVNCQVNFICKQPSAECMEAVDMQRVMSELITARKPVVAIAG